MYTPSLLCCFLLSFSALLQAQQGILYRVNPFESMYIASPTGFGMQKGQRIFHAPGAVLNRIQVAVSDRMTVGGGAFPILLFFNGSEFPVMGYAAVRRPLGLDKPTLNVWTHMIQLTDPNQVGKRFGMAAFGALTFGTRNKNWSIGLGQVVRSTDSQPGRPFMLLLHGSVRLRKRSCLVTENYVIATQDGLVPLSILAYRRWNGRAGWDIGWGTVRVPSTSIASTDLSLIPFPWFSWQYRFGSR